jgi:sulfur-oxidizing protein SoxY
MAGVTLASPPNASDDAAELIKHLTGKTPTESDRLHLAMPRVFANGYTVPLTLVIDSPMTEADHVRDVRVLAPRNPLITVATFHFVPQRSEPRVSTRIRLAQPQNVLAVAPIGDNGRRDVQGCGRQRHTGAKGWASRDGEGDRQSRRNCAR